MKGGGISQISPQLFYDDLEAVIWLHAELRHASLSTALRSRKLHPPGDFRM